MGLKTKIPFLVSLLYMYMTRSTQTTSALRLPSIDTYWLDSLLQAQHIYSYVQSANLIRSVLWSFGSVIRSFDPLVRSFGSVIGSFGPLVRSFNRPWASISLGDTWVHAMAYISHSVVRHALSTTNYSDVVPSTRMPLKLSARIARVRSTVFGGNSQLRSNTRSSSLYPPSKKWPLCRRTMLSTVVADILDVSSG